MTDGIGRIGGSNYGYVGFGPQKQNDDVAQNPTPQQPVNNYEETQMDPSKVLDLLSANSNLFVGATNKPGPVELDQATQDRIANSMKNFELFVSVASEEVGEDLALLLADEYIRL